MFVVYDLETSGLPKSRNAPYTESEQYDSCRVMSIALVLLNKNKEIIEKYYAVVKPNSSYKVGAIPFNLHKISWNDANETGVEFEEVLKKLEEMLDQSKYIVAHNLHGFDLPVFLSECFSRRHYKIIEKMQSKRKICTMIMAGKHFKKRFMRLDLTYGSLFPGKELVNAHHALDDAVHCAECLQELLAKR